MAIDPKAMAERLGVPAARVTVGEQASTACSSKHMGRRSVWLWSERPHGSSVAASPFSHSYVSFGPSVG